MTVSTRIPRANRALLAAAGVGLVAIALVHAVAIVLGPSAYETLDAAPLAELARQGSPLPAIVTVGVT